MFFKLLIIFWAFVSSPQAMLSDGIHPPEDYVKFAETQDAFKASCFVYDHFRHVLQTGVLIRPDIVMTAAHGLEGARLEGIIVGFGDAISHTSPHNYKVKALRTHPRYYSAEFPMQGKYDIVFLKLTKRVENIQPVPLFEEERLEEIPPLYVATFGSADVPHGAPVRRRAFVLPESDIFSITGRDPEALYDFKTVMMGAIFFEPNDNLKPVKPHGSERALRTYKANRQWRKLHNPPYALALPGSSGAPVFINLTKDRKVKTYVFGLIQSFSHLSASSFRHATGDRETRHLLQTKRDKLYGHYQSVFCIPYKLYQPLEAYKDPPRIYRLSRRIKKILDELEVPHPPLNKKPKHSPPKP